MNLIRREGAEVHTAERGVHRSAPSRSPPGDYIVRLDQPYGGDRRDAAGRAVLRAGEPAAVRRHRLGDPARAQRQESSRSQTKSILTAADDAGDRATSRSPARSRAPAGAHRRSHDRQHAGDVPLPARGREDVGGGAGVRGGRPQVRAGRVRHRRREPRRRSSRRSRSSGFRRGPSTPRRTCRCTISTCRGSATSTRGPARRTKAGSGWRSTTSRCPTPTSPPSCAQGNLQAEVRRDRLPARGPGRHGAHLRRRAGQRAAAVQEDGADTPHLGIQDSTDDMRGSLGVEGLHGAVQVRAGGRRADHRRRHVDGLPRVQPHAGDHRSRRRRTSTRAARC